MTALLPSAHPANRHAISDKLIDEIGPTRVTSPIGVLVRRHRLAAGLTQAELADRALMSMRGIQDIERGITQPYVSTIQRLVEALALDPERRREIEAARAPLRRRVGSDG